MAFISLHLPFGWLHVHLSVCVSVCALKVCTYCLINICSLSDTHNLIVTTCKIHQFARPPLLTALISDLSFENTFSPFDLGGNTRGTLCQSFSFLAQSNKEVSHALQRLWWWTCLTISIQTLFVNQSWLHWVC